MKIQDSENEHLAAVRAQFQWSLQALAMSAETQRSLFPEFVLQVDELALDFDHWYKVAQGLDGTNFSPQQLELLEAINARLEAMSRGGPRVRRRAMDRARPARAPRMGTASFTRAPGPVSLRLVHRATTSWPIGLCARDMPRRIK